MAAQIFNRIGQMGLGLALAGGVINSALYNGRYSSYLSSPLITHSPSHPSPFQLTVASVL